jgi:hypothetical protein
MPTLIVPQLKTGSRSCPPFFSALSLEASRLAEAICLGADADDAVEAGKTGNVTLFRCHWH